MVDLIARPPHLQCEVRGWHQFLAFKRRLRLPLAAVQSVRRDLRAAAGLWKGVRLPGTHVPGLITAGSYYWAGAWTFYDVVDPHNAVVVELAGADYDRLVVEVADSKATVRAIRQTIY
jgi:hypothetical protein